MAYLYPWGNTQELNLDWIIQKIKELENGGASGASIEEIANVLVALTYRSANTYQRYDYAFYNGKLYRATANTTGVFNPGDWLEVQIGNDVAILTRLVNAVDASLTTLQGQVENLDTDDVDNASNVTGTSTSDALNNLNDAINLIRNRRFVFISDSYGVSADNWITQTIALLGLTLNDNAFNISASSTGFLGDPDLSGDYTWKTLLTNNLSNITNRDTITDVIVCGGTNDIGHTYPDLRQAVLQFKAYVNSDLPNAKISIGFIGRKNTGSNVQDYGTYANYYSEIATKTGCVYIANSEACWGYTSNFADTWHPNSTGSALIAASIANYVMTGIGSALNSSLSASPNKIGLTANASGTLQQIYQNASNGLYMIGSKDIDTVIISSTAITCNDSWQELYEIPNAIVAGNGLTIVGGSISIYDPTNGNYPLIPCQYRYYDNKIWIKMPWKGYTGTNTFSCNSTQIKFAVPLMIMTMKGN